MTFDGEFMAAQDTPSSVPVRRLPQWQVEYESALRETDPRLLFKKVEIAEAALLNGRESLDDPYDPQQRSEIDVALSSLRQLKKEILNF
jgi:hypothetical protein